MSVELEWFLVGVPVGWLLAIGCMLAIVGWRHL
jgi:hypothetical protein